MQTALLVAMLIAVDPAEPLVVAAKPFTESAILARMAISLAEHHQVPVKDHAQELHGTQLTYGALLRGEVDAYPEYTGTMRKEIFADETLPDLESLRSRLAEVGLGMTDPLGFDNSYEIGIAEETAASLNLTAISELRQHPDLRFGFSNEFMGREDGWPGLRRHYRLPHEKIKALEHGRAYFAVDAGDFDGTDVYTTDPNIRRHNLRVLVDDAEFFPRYDAVFLYRLDLEQKAPELVAALRGLSGKIDQEAMLDMNEQVEMAERSPGVVAAEFLGKTFGVSVEYREETLMSRVMRTTWQHLFLVTVSLVVAIPVSILGGIAASKNALAEQLILGTTEIIQTIPGLALIAFIGALFMWVGLPTVGAIPVVTALFLYSLLPIIRNTTAGLTGVPHGLKESAIALGLSPLSRLWLIELPMASRMILAGIKTTAVITVGYAALGALLGAGGYGEPILEGLRLAKVDRTLEGAVPAAVLALLVKGLFEWAERWLVPTGLRIQARG